LRHKIKKQSLVLWVVLLILLIISILPIFWTIFNSFKSNFEIMNTPFALPKKFGFTNLVNAWVVGNFKLYFLNTFIVAIGGCVIVIALACPAGYALAQIEFKGSKFWFYMLFIGLSIPSQTMAISVFYRLRSMNLIDSLFGLILVLVGMSMPFSIFLMRNTYKDMSKELRESAFIDGASEWKTFLYIIFPLGSPGTLALIVFTFMGFWNEYLYPLILLISPNKYTVAIGVASFQTEQFTDYGLIFGAAVLSLIPSIIIYIIFQRSFTQGTMVGSQKG
jgi:ABC-type glycerol-3-phosphate transport system permease component